MALVSDDTKEFLLFMLVMIMMIVECKKTFIFLKGLFKYVEIK